MYTTRDLLPVGHSLYQPCSSFASLCLPTFVSTLHVTGAVFSFSQVCQLRPAVSKTGQCHFAYPLHKTSSGRVLSFAETKKAGLADYKPVHPSEYNLTEEEEAAALASVRELLSIFLLDLQLCFLWMCVE